MLNNNIIEMDLIRTEELWNCFNTNKSRSLALEYFIEKLSSINHELIVLRCLWGLDYMIGCGQLTPKEVAHNIACSDYLKAGVQPFFRCAFKFLIKLIFFLDYKSNREVFNKTVEKSSHFTELINTKGRCLAVDPIIDAIMKDVDQFMNSFTRMARLLYTRVHQGLVPFCGVASHNLATFRMESSSLNLTSVRGSIRFPDFLSGAQSNLTTNILGQLRSAEFVSSLLDSSNSKTKIRCTGLENCLVDLIVNLMELTEETNNIKWVRQMFDHLLSMVVAMMPTTIIRFNGIIVKLNAKLSDFAPCLRLFDILMPESDDPDGTLPDPVACRLGSNNNSAAVVVKESTSPTIADSIVTGGQVATNAVLAEDDDCEPPIIKSELPMEVDSTTAGGSADAERNEGDDSEDEYSEDSCSSDSENESDYSIDPHLDLFLPGYRQHSSRARRKRQGRTLHLAASPVCLWQHILRKSQVSQERLPRVMPPALKPADAYLARQMQSLLAELGTENSEADDAQLDRLTWKQLVIILNASSTINDANLVAQRLVDLLWLSTDSSTTASTHHKLQPLVADNGSVELPYGLIASGRVQPLSRQLIGMMTIHMRMVLLHAFMHKFNQLHQQPAKQYTTPGVIETFCRLFDCRSVQNTYASQIMQCLFKLHLRAKSTATTDSSGPNDPSPINDPAGESSNHVIITLIDLVGHRLVDQLKPDSRVSTFSSLVSLTRHLLQSSSGCHGDSESDLERGGEMLQLYYTLEWTVAKAGRSLSTPDCALYTLAAASDQQQSRQITASSGSGSHQQAVGQPTAAAIRQSAAAGRSGHDSISSSGELIAQPQTVLQQQVIHHTLGGAPSSLAGASVSTSPELSRFLLLTFVQIYNAYDLDEVLSYRTLLLDHSRSVVSASSANRSGIRSTNLLVDHCPTLLIKRLPDFLLTHQHHHVVAKPVVTTTDSPPKSPFGDGDSPQLPVGRRLVQLTTTVAANYDRFLGADDTGASGNVNNWNMSGENSDLLYCMMLRHLVIQTSSLPGQVVRLAQCLPISRANACLRKLCDYIVGCLIAVTTFSSAVDFDEVMINSDKCLSALCEFVILRSVIPLDRFLIFLLMQPHYQGQALEAVCTIIVHIFTKCPRLQEAIGLLSSVFPVSPPTSSSSEKHNDQNKADPDPVSSRQWFACIKQLHQLLPDGQCCLHEPVAADNQLPDATAVPVVYGHVVLRLLTLIELCFSLFLDCHLPLDQLVPFCRSVSPLLRFHRRPINLCYMLLREYWRFFRDDCQPPPVSGNSQSGNSTSSNFSSTSRLPNLHRIRLHVVLHCILAPNHRSAVSHGGALLTSEAWQSRLTLLIGRIHQVVANHQSPLDSPTDLENALLRAYESESSGSRQLPNTPAIIDPIIESLENHGIKWHPAAWRPWIVEESVTIQAAGLYAAAVETMAWFYTPNSCVRGLTELVASRASGKLYLPTLNVVGALVSILPAVYRAGLLEFTSTLFTDPALNDIEPASQATSANDEHPNNQNRPVKWPPVTNWVKRHPLVGETGQEEDESKNDRCRAPQAAVDFFTTWLRPEHSTGALDGDQCSSPPTGRHLCMVKADLWHAIWFHANTSQINSLPNVCKDFIFKHLDNEAKLLMLFYLVGPLMGPLHAERPAKLLDLTGELYRCLCQVDATLAGSTNQSNVASDASRQPSLLPGQTGIPLVHVDALADILYHIKYMYVGNGVLDTVRPLMPRMRPMLRKRLKFILPAGESIQMESVVADSTSTLPSQEGNGHSASTIYEGRLYKAASVPPLPGEQF